MSFTDMYYHRMMCLLSSWIKVFVLPWCLNAMPAKWSTLLTECHPPSNGIIIYDNWFLQYEEVDETVLDIPCFYLFNVYYVRSFVILKFV